MLGIALDVLGKDKHYGIFCPVRILQKFISPSIYVFATNLICRAHADHLNVSVLVEFVAPHLFLVHIVHIAISVRECQPDVLPNKTSLALVILEEHGVLGTLPLGVNGCNVLLTMVPFDVLLDQT